MDEFSYDEYWQSLPVDCQNVVNKISRSVTHSEFSDHDSASGKQWCGRIYWDYISSYGKSGNERAAFRNEVDQHTTCNYKTIESVNKQGLSEKNARVAFCFSAYISHKYLKKTIQEFILEFLSYSNKRPSNFDFTEISNNINVIKSEFENSKNATPLTLKNDSPPDEGPSYFQKVLLSYLEPPRKQDPRNINYFGNRAIKNIGREKELAQLQGFLECKEKPFSWFQISGSGGMGKSRLAYELILKAESQGWNAGFLDRKHDDVIQKILAEEEHGSSSLQESPSAQNYLLVVDYLVGREELIRSLICSFSQYDAHEGDKFRLLLLERQRWDQAAVDKNSDKNSEDIHLGFYLL
ncbi:MAG: hypothetical protein ACPGMR_02845 [Pontibacterium sp.]